MITRERLLTKLQRMVSDPRNTPYLQEALITQRDGRYVIPLRSEFKGRIKAIVHDQSSSGATLFVEPFGVVEHNNSIMRLSVDGIPDTRNALIDGQTGQLITDINNMYARLDYSRITEFSNQDWAFYLTFAKRQWKDFYWGANIKIIRRDIAEFGATGIGFDIGAYWMPIENLSVGGNLQDATTTLVAWSTGTNELISPTLKVGSAYRITEILGGYIMPAVDFDIRFENRQFATQFNIGPVSFDAHAGLEWNIKNIVYIRGGYSDATDSGMARFGYKTLFFSGRTASGRVAQSAFILRHRSRSGCSPAPFHHGSRYECGPCQGRKEA